MSNANKRQVGGDHYKTGGEEHWDRVARLGLDYFQGQITKYVERWKKKNGLQDLHKARHFLDKYIELNSPLIELKTPEDLRDKICCCTVDSRCAMHVLKDMDGNCTCECHQGEDILHATECCSQMGQRFSAPDGEPGRNYVKQE